MVIRSTKYASAHLPIIGSVQWGSVYFTNVHRNTLSDWIDFFYVSILCMCTGCIAKYWMNIDFQQAKLQKEYGIHGFLHE